MYTLNGCCVRKEEGGEGEEEEGERERKSERGGKDGLRGGGT